MTLGNIYQPAFNGVGKMTCRPHPIPKAHVGETIRYKNGRKTQTGKILEIAEGHGWPCYLVTTEDFPDWVGHENLLAD